MEAERKAREKTEKVLALAQAREAKQAADERIRQGKAEQKEMEQRFASRLARARALLDGRMPEMALQTLEEARKAGWQTVDMHPLWQRVSREAQERALELAKQEQVVAESPEDTSGRFVLGYLYLERHRPADAIRQYEDLARLKPDDSNVLLNLAYAYRMNHEAEKAEGILRKAMTIEPTNARAYNDLAYLLLSTRKNVGEAIVLGQKAHELAGDEPAILDTIGYGHYLLGDNTRAAEYLSRAVLKTADDEVRYHYSLVLVKRGDNEKAKALLAKMVSGHSEWASSARELLNSIEAAEAAEERRRLEVASQEEQKKQEVEAEREEARKAAGKRKAAEQAKIREVRKEAEAARQKAKEEAVRAEKEEVVRKGREHAEAETTRQKAERVMSRVQVLMDGGKAETALRMLRELHQSGVESAGSRALLARAERAVKERSRALAEQENRTQAFPNDPEARFALGYSYLLRGRPGEAAEQYEALARMKPDDSNTFLNLGYSYREAGDVEKASGAYRRAMALDPENPKAYNDLAYLYLHAQQDVPEAIALGEKALSLAPDDPAVMDTLGYGYYLHGDLARSHDLLSRAARRGRSDELFFHFGLVLAKLGHTRQARAEFERVVRMHGEFAEEASAALQNLPPQQK
ncbi:MAG: tetratricopeptide repeat protein [Planctomycetes bacterium]|nr:tetratricopeptide repeat protein [Planctomycetota bacterium]